MTRELDGHLSFRCNTDLIKKFKTWCKRKNIDHQEFMRGVMTAGPDGRLKMEDQVAHLKTLVLNTHYTVRVAEADKLRFREWVLGMHRAPGQFLRQVIEAAPSGGLDVLKEDEV